MHLVFLVHGMGKHAPGWSDPIQAFLRGRSEAFTAKPFPDTTRFVEINYDEVFRGWMKRWAEAGSELASFPEVASVAGFLATLDKDDPVYTHVADVVLFTLFPQIALDVISMVRTQIFDAHAANRTAQVSILAHSLGTSVIQRTVATLDNPSLGGQYPPSLLQFANLIMVANVSRVLTLPHPNDVYDTLSRPGPKGSCANYWSIHHAWDVITMPWAFQPPIAPWATEPGTYLDTEVAHFEPDPNVHDLLNYLKNPRVHLPLLARVAGLRIAVPEFQALVASYEASHKLENELKNRLEPLVARAAGMDQADLQEVLDLLKTFLKTCGVKG